jgi:AcrR family transcriptional regulator
VPRVTQAHEQAVRQRIVDAAIKVFGEMGYQRATVQDVVRESGLSVGAVYTHFKNKEELFLIACACEIDAQKADLRLRMAELGSLTDRLRAAVDFAVDSTVMGVNDHSIRGHVWMVAEGSPDLRQILRDRRTEMVAFAKLILQEALIRGELPAWVDADSIASAFITLMDGFVIVAAESGGITRDQAKREAYALMELLIAAPMELPARVAELRGVAAAARVS